VSRWNAEITSGLYHSALETVLNLGVAEVNILSVEVPGAFEIPLALSRLAELEAVDGLVALGAVIKGETAHFEYISDSVMSGLREVSLKYGIPVGCGVLTTMDEAQAKARSGASEMNKGREATEAVIEMISLSRKLRELKDVGKLDNISDNH
jgi:6,7-dimethyl-8-ribityllumazine synthase